MSELKAGVIVTPHDEGMCFDWGTDAIAVIERETEFYLKSEADKVIAHHKYKRCFKMARWCISMMVFNSKYGTDKKWHLFKKWRDRWMALAENFKHNKEAK